MKIQFNTGSRIEGSNRLSDYFSNLIKEDLSRFEHQITRIEVHLSDQDGTKNGPNDKRCMLEAHLKYINPITVTHNGNSPEEAIKGAIDKLKSSLSTIIGRLKTHFRV